jgi:hypothetical protein
MSEIITFIQQSQPSGFTNTQFKKLDALYLLAASQKVLRHRTVEVDFDAGTASYTYYKAEGQAPLMQFVIRKVGPRTTMYEMYVQGAGRAIKSGVFEKVYSRLEKEIMGLLNI